MPIQFSEMRNESQSMFTYQKNDFTLNGIISVLTGLVCFVLIWIDCLFFVYMIESNRVLPFDFDFWLVDIYIFGEKINLIRLQLPTFNTKHIYIIDSWKKPKKQKKKKRFTIAVPNNRASVYMYVPWCMMDDTVLNCYTIHVSRFRICIFFIHISYHLTNRSKKREKWFAKFLVFSSFLFPFQWFSFAPKIC